MIVDIIYQYDKSYLVIKRISDAVIEKETENIEIYCEM